MPQQFDLVILGSALRAAELGKTAVMTEARIVGGTCVNRGCIPSKNLIDAARIVYESAHPRYPGLAPARIGVDFRAPWSNKKMKSSMATDTRSTRVSLEVASALRRATFDLPIPTPWSRWQAARR